MITEDKVAEIFVLQMIFAKFLMHRWQNIRLRQNESASITVKAACVFEYLPPTSYTHK